MTGQERQPERLIARVRPHARCLILPSLAFVAASGGATYGIFVVDELWQRLTVAAGALAAVIVFWMLPLLRWLSTQYLITTRRLVLRRGLLVRTRQEVLLSRSSDVSVRRSGLQSMFRSGDVLIGAGLDRPIALRDVPRADLVQEALADLMEASTSSIATVRRPPEASDFSTRRSRNSG